MMDESSKICSKCREDWPATLEFFYSRKSSKDGLREVCKACYSEYPSVIKRTKKFRNNNHG